MMLLLLSLTSSAYLLFLNLGALLTATDTVGKADLVISTNGSPGRIAKAVELYHQGCGERLLATTGESYRMMVGRGVAPEGIAGLRGRRTVAMKKRS